MRKLQEGESILASTHLTFVDALFGSDNTILVLGNELVNCISFTMHTHSTQVHLFLKQEQEEQRE